MSIAAARDKLIRHFYYCIDSVLFKRFCMVFLIMFGTLNPGTKLEQDLTLPAGLYTLTSGDWTSGYPLNAVGQGTQSRSADIKVSGAQRG